MTEYIERERLIGSLEDVIADYRDEHTFSTDFAATVVIDILNNIVKCQPAADVEPVQEWIPVYDELPEVGGYVVCIAKRNPFSRFMPMVARIEKNGWVNPITEQYISEVTHWMPLPSTEGLE